MRVSCGLGLLLAPAAAAEEVPDVCATTPPPQLAAGGIEAALEGTQLLFGGAEAAGANGWVNDSLGIASPGAAVFPDGTITVTTGLGDGHVGGSRPAPRCPASPSHSLAPARQPWAPPPGSPAPWWPSARATAAARGRPPPPARPWPSCRGSAPPARLRR